MVTKKEMAVFLRDMADYIESDDVQLCKETIIKLSTELDSVEEMGKLAHFQTGKQSVEIQFELYNRQQGETSKQDALNSII